MSKSNEEKEIVTTILFALVFLCLAQCLVVIGIKNYSIKKERQIKMEGGILRGQGQEYLYKMFKNFSKKVNMHTHT